MENFIIIGAVILIAIIAIVLVCVGKVKAVKQWLKYAVAEAEQYFGSKTGKLKLQYVYNCFAEKFSVISSFITFDVFSKWVDKALETLNDWLETNENIASVIEGREEK